MDKESSNEKESGNGNGKCESPPSTTCPTKEPKWNFETQNVGIYYAATSTPFCPISRMYGQNQNSPFFPSRNLAELQGPGQLGSMYHGEVPQHFYGSYQPVRVPPYCTPAAQQCYQSISEQKMPRRELILPQCISPFVQEFPYPVYPYSAPAKTHLMRDKLENFHMHSPFYERQGAFPHTDAKHAKSKTPPLLETQKKKSTATKASRARRRLGYDSEMSSTQINTVTDRKEKTPSVGCQIDCSHESNDGMRNFKESNNTNKFTLQSSGPASDDETSNYHQYNGKVTMVESGMTAQERTHETHPVEETRVIHSTNTPIVSFEGSSEETGNATEISDLMYTVFGKEAVNVNWLETDLAPKTNSEINTKNGEIQTSCDLGGKNESELVQLQHIDGIDQRNRDQNIITDGTTVVNILICDGTPVTVKLPEDSKHLETKDSRLMFIKDTPEGLKNQHANDSFFAPLEVNTVNSDSINCIYTAVLNSTKLDLSDESLFKSFENPSSNSVLKLDCSDNGDLAQPLSLDVTLEHVTNSGNGAFLNLSESSETNKGIGETENHPHQAANAFFDSSIDDIVSLLLGPNLGEEKFINEEVIGVNTTNTAGTTNTVETTDTVEVVNTQVVDSATQTDEINVIKIDVSTQTNQHEKHTKDVLQMCSRNSATATPNQFKVHERFKTNDRSESKSTTKKNYGNTLRTLSNSDTSPDSISVSQILTSLSAEFSEEFDHITNGQPSSIRASTKTYYGLGAKCDQRNKCFKKVLEKVTVYMYQGENDNSKDHHGSQESPVSTILPTVDGTLEKPHVTKKLPIKIKIPSTSGGPVSKNLTEDMPNVFGQKKNKRSPKNKSPKKRVTFAEDFEDQRKVKMPEMNRSNARKGPRKKSVKDESKKTILVTDIKSVEDETNCNVSSLATGTVCDEAEAPKSNKNSPIKRWRVRSNARYDLRRLE